MSTLLSRFWYAHSIHHREAVGLLMRAEGVTLMAALWLFCDVCGLETTYESPLPVYWVPVIKITPQSPIFTFREAHGASHICANAIWHLNCFLVDHMDFTSRSVKYLLCDQHMLKDQKGKSCDLVCQRVGQEAQPWKLRVSQQYQERQYQHWLHSSSSINPKAHSDIHVNSL